MLAKTQAAAVLGVDAYPVEVEVDLASGLPYYSTVGLPDAAVKESKDRIRAAIVNTGFIYPMGRITVSLSPADVRKEGSAFDLPIALSLLRANGVFHARSRMEDALLFLGELALDGSLRPIRGALNVAVLARKMGRRGVVLPAENAPEAAVVEELEIYPVHTLPQVVGFIREEIDIPAARRLEENGDGRREVERIDFLDIRGQRQAKRAVEVAAAGSHNLLMIGPPGSGKSMLAKRFPTILPPLSLDEAIETSQVWSVLGKLTKRDSLIRERPFRAPHHTISDAGLVGGGALPLPGEASLAHNGVLFLDELPEFRKNVLESLRGPLEDGRITISRAQASLSFPARFMLAAAMNPCDCGLRGDGACACAPRQVARYRSRVSGPILDRIDIHVPVPRVPWKELAEDPEGESSRTIRERVLEAQATQKERLRDHAGVYANAHMGPALINEHCGLEAEGMRLLQMAVERLGLSARAYHRVLKVARTIADLGGDRDIAPQHVAEAVQYRQLDRRPPA